MVDILHRIAIKSSPAEVYSALTTTEGLAGWWTTDTEGKGNDVGGVLRFQFPNGGFDMKTLDLDPDKHVLWEVVEGPAEWIGTHVDWDLSQADDHTVILFKHKGWEEPVEFMHHCSTKWATFLLSLKSLIENGKGSPAPDDVKIDNWN
ncbi:SRPBCC domain-containing protein [Streptosporangium longisporum]|uniref:SRPBCC domain-containing protein n=1 Tax=Streptosporangium longisporum TaxID=46187 RepID=A0ABN3XVK4_9ACTN